MSAVGTGAPLPVRILVPGEGAVELLRLDEPLSFWGGVDPATGQLVDPQHPQAGVSLRGVAVALPGVRGSTAAPGAMLECLRAGTAPAALLLRGDAVAPFVAGYVGEFLGLRPLPLGVLDVAWPWKRLASGQQLIMADTAWRLRDL